MARKSTGKAKVLSKSQIKAVLLVLQTPRERAMFLCSAKAAMRAIEISGLQWRHVRENMLELTKDITKGGKPREVPLNPELRAAFDEMRSQSDVSDEDLVFPNRHQHSKPKPMTANAVVQWFRYLYRTRMGFEGQYSSHSGRRTAITAIARKIHEAGGSMVDAADIAGHSSVKTTQGYVEGSKDAKRKVMDMI